MKLSCAVFILGYPAGGWLSYSMRQMALDWPSYSRSPNCRIWDILNKKMDVDVWIPRPPHGSSSTKQQPQIHSAGEQGCGST